MEQYFLFKIDEIFKGSCESRMEGANMEIEYTIKNKLSKIHSSREVHTVQDCSNVQVAVKYNNSFVNIFESYESKSTPYVNISMNDLWIRMPQRTLETLLKEGKRYLNGLDDELHREQEEDLASEND